MICSLSGQDPVEPVISPAGYVFEKSLIEKYLSQNDNCPVSGDPLSIEELIPIKINKAVQPRPAGGASVPGLLQIFQNEWDASVLETFTLKKQLDSVRQELAHALYQHDASCRVIARLIKERDDAREALIELREQVKNQPSGAAMEVEEGFPSEVEKQMKILSQELSAKRSKRDTSALPGEKIKQFSEKQSNAVHKASKPGILSVDVHSKDADKIVTGGVDCNAVLFDRSEKKKLATLTGHSKPVSQVAFHGETTTIATGSQDKTVRIWNAAEGTTDYKSQKISSHTGEITSLHFHPLSEYIVSTSRDKTWGFHNIENAVTVASSSGTDVNSPILCGDVHPDCLLLATGQQDGTINLWNIAAQSVVMSFANHKNGTKALQFSENGYQIVTGGSSEVLLWDLRKIKEPVTTAKLGDSFDLSCLSLTNSSAYLAAAGSSVVLYHTQTLEELVTLSDHSERVTGVQWDHAGTSLASVSLDRTLKIYSA